MQVVAVGKDIGISTEKLGLVADAVRGKKADQAMAILSFARTPAAQVVATIVKSAMANAENNYQLVPSDLVVVKIVADQGRRMKRFRARARGRASPILKRSSHVTVILATKES